MGFIVQPCFKAALRCFCGCKREKKKSHLISHTDYNHCIYLKNPDCHCAEHCPLVLYTLEIRAPANLLPGAHTRCSAPAKCAYSAGLCVCECLSIHTEMEFPQKYKRFHRWWSESMGTGEMNGPAALMTDTSEYSTSTHTYLCHNDTRKQHININKQANRPGASSSVSEWERTGSSSRRRRQNTCLYFPPLLARPCALKFQH